MVTDNDKNSEAMKANARYSKSIFPLLLKYGSHPVFVSKVQGRFLVTENSEDWDQVAMVRYRSRRDFIKMATEAGKKNLGEDKWLSIQKTHVFPVKSIIHFGSIRLGLAVVLIIMIFIINIFMI